MDQSPVIQQSAPQAFSDDPASDGDDSSTRGSFDNQGGDHSAGRQRSKTQVAAEEVNFESQQRRRMTDPLPGYVLQTEEIDIEPLAAIEIQFPTTAQFERGVKLSRRATYTPLFTPQFHSSMSLKGIADPYRRASLGSRMEAEPQSEKLEFDRQEKPELPMDRHRTPSKPVAKPVTNERTVNTERTPPANNQSEADASPSSKASRRSRLKSLGRWFKIKATITLVSLRLQVGAGNFAPKGNLRRRGETEMKGNVDGNDAALPLPLLTRDVFPAHLVPCFKYETLTKVQQRVLRAAFADRDNLMVSAPTGSGKTTILEAAFLQVFERSRGSPATKVVYIAPVKAVLQERLTDWRSRFGESTTGLNFIELSGDRREIDESDVEAAHVLLSTPEKWDAITRSGGANARLVGAVELLLVDEIHHIGDATRGATLEAVILRMMNLRKREHEEFSWQPIRDMRIVGLSATFSNATEMAEWIKCPPHGLFQFGSEFRPVPLTCRVIGCGDASNAFVFESNLDGRVFDIVRQFSGGKPSLVFCNSRIATTRLAAHLAAEVKRAGIFDPTKRDRLAMLNEIEESGTGLKLLNTLRSGIGYHHAGLTPVERATVEDIFRKNKLPVLCCTSSLAVGVNLPAHLVIIKSTRLYQGNERYVNYPGSQILQMIGRAGRPSFDSSGVAVVLTENTSVEHFRDLVSGSAIITVKSQLPRNLPGILNTEIVLGTVRDERGANRWLEQTFFAKNAEHPTTSEEHIVQAALETLARSGMIQCQNDGSLEATVAGSIMTQNYIDLETMKEIIKDSTKRRTFEDLLVMLSRCSEVRISMRRQEKNELNQLNDTSAKFRVTNPDGTHSINSDEAKTNILIQAVLSKSRLGNPHLEQEANQAIDESTRILAALAEYLQRKDDGESLWTVLRLQRCLALRSWDDSVGRYSLQQIPAIDSSTASALEYIGIRSIRQLALASPRRIDDFLRRDPPVGQQLVDQAIAHAHFQISASWDQRPRGPLKTLRISVTSNAADKAGPATLIVWNATSLLQYQHSIINACEYEVHVPEDYHEKIQIRLLQEKTIGLDTRVEIDQELKVEKVPSRHESGSGFDVKESELRDIPEPIPNPGPILSSIMNLTSRHAKAKQQQIPRFLVKKNSCVELAPPEPESIGVKRPNPVAIRDTFQDSQGSIKQRKQSKVAPICKAAEGLSNTTGSQNVRRTTSIHFQKASKKTQTTILFDKFRFKNVSKIGKNTYLENEEEGSNPTAPSHKKPNTIVPQAAVEELPPKAIRCTQAQSIHAHFRQPPSSGNFHPFLETYLRDKAKNISEEGHCSLLENARSSIDYSFLRRFVEQPEISSDLSQDDDDVFGATEYSSSTTGTSIVQIEEEHPFRSIFF